MTPRPQQNIPLVVAYGGGLNSTAMLVLLISKLCIRPDLILFADTGGEKPETIEHISVVNRWLGEKTIDPIKVVRTVDRSGVEITLEGRCLADKALPSLAYGFKSCSDKHKQRPQSKFLNHWPLAVAAWGCGKRVRKAVGFDAGEHRRTRPSDNKYEHYYPLIEQGWYREDCEREIRCAGLPVPIKSACFFCPASKKHEIDWLRSNHPDLFNRAIQMERNAADNLQTVKGLGRKFSWEQYAKMSDEERLKAAECAIDEPCGCFDEGEP